jgi:hypothetical protein
MVRRMRFGQDGRVAVAVIVHLRGSRQAEDEKLPDASPK